MSFFSAKLCLTLLCQAKKEALEAERKKKLSDEKVTMHVENFERALPFSRFLGREGNCSRRGEKESRARAGNCVSYDKKNARM